MNLCSMPVRAGLAGFLVMAALLATSGARACGYHDPSALNLGMLNWSYPDALHVRTAVWMAQQSGLIAASAAPLDDDPLPPAMRQQLRLRETTAQLEALRGRLAAGADGRVLAGFSIVLLRSMLWARFEPTGDTLRLDAHTPGPGADDVVLVTDEPVIDALLDGRLTPRDAQQRGLLRFYGAPAAVAQLGTLFNDLAPQQTAQAQPWRPSP
jgi:hypothetical protein